MSSIRQGSLQPRQSAANTQDRQLTSSGGEEILAGALGSHNQTVARILRVATVKPSADTTAVSAEITLLDSHEGGSDLETFHEELH